jgi:ribosomal-protein-alanine N-acetyltransferase
MSAVLERPTFGIRNMNKTDIEAVMKIETSVYAFPWTDQIFLDCLKVGYLCQLCIEDGHIAAYSILSVEAKVEAHILNLCVDPSRQNRGIGQALLGKMLDNAKQKKVETVFLEVRPSNHSAISLYNKMGFNQVGNRKNYYPAHRGREDAIIFALDLTQ